MKKLVTGICLAALLLAAGFVGFTLNENQRGDAGQTAKQDKAGESKTSGQQAEISVPSVGATGDEANKLIQLNQIIFEVAQENARRPKDRRMSAEEIKDLVRSRVEELTGEQ